LLYIDVSGAKFIVMTDSSHHVDPGDPCYPQFDDWAVYLFGAATGDSITHEYLLQDIRTAFHVFDSGESGKVVIVRD
jgi:hypothetical protein